MRQPNIFRKGIHLFRETFIQFLDDSGIKLSAALSYYTIFSLPPLLIIIISLSGFIFGDEAVNGELFWQIQGMIGKEAALQVQETIKNVKLSNSTTFATTFGLIVLFIGASGVFAEIQESLNLIWGIKAKPQKGFIKFIKNRLMSFSMIGSVGFLLLVGLIVNSTMDLLNNRLAAMFSLESLHIFYYVNIIIVFIIITSLFTVIFRTLPDGKVNFKDCLIGATFTALLFMLGKYVIGAYLASSLMTTAYGAAGSVILILVWVYYSAIILYFGAEFTKVYAQTHGQKIILYNYAESRITKIPGLGANANTVITPPESPETRPGLFY